MALDLLLKVDLDYLRTVRHIITSKAIEYCQSNGYELIEIVWEKAYPENLAKDYFETTHESQKQFDAWYAQALRFLKGEKA